MRLLPYTYYGQGATLVIEREGDWRVTIRCWPNPPHLPHISATGIAATLEAAVAECRRQIAMNSDPQRAVMDTILTTGLLSLVTQRVRDLEAGLRTALWIRGVLQDHGAKGAGLEEWDDIETLNEDNLTPSTP
jgi:cell division protein ZapA (FtsZ GTPase activity inhibitor)